MFKKLFFISLYLMFSGCIIKNQNENKPKSKELKILPGNWGHLSSESLVPNSPIYLINKKANEPYNICLAQYMVEKFPGIQEEIIASANIWSHYIGREIQIKINIKDLPRGTKNEDEDQLLNNYYKICGPKTELVIGLGPIGDNNVGKVIPMYTYDPEAWNKRREIKSFKSALFLQDENLKKLDWKFISFQDFLKSENAISSEEILNILKSRSEIYYAKLNHYITLPVLMHEFGHVWGLCDQYEGSSNCDEKFSSLDKEGHVLLNKDSTMYSINNKFSAFLRDDDITGIRKLALRKGFKAGYNLTDQEIEFEIPKIEIRNKNIFEENFFRIASDNNNKLEANLLFIVFEPYTLKAKVFSDAYGWITYNYKSDPIPFESSNFSLKFDKPNNEKSKIQRVKIELNLLNSNETKSLDLFFNED
ncbi:MAG: hypothetical protein U0T83_06005 [Bacteriovoracaceae bacterium]